MGGIIQKYEGMADKLKVTNIKEGLGVEIQIHARTLFFIMSTSRVDIQARAWILERKNTWISTPGG